MSDTPNTFVAVGDSYLAELIGQASRRVIYLAPGVATATATALVRHMAPHGDRISLTIVLDADADAYRIGYGDPGALTVLYEEASQAGYQIRRQTGLRIGLLVVDDNTVIWSPTPLAVEGERGATEPNGVVLRGPVATKVESVVGANGSGTGFEKAEIGREPLQSSQIEEVIKDLAENPPAPFDLSRRSRVFSTRFQFVEFEVRGAEWTERRIKLSSLLLNADLPEAMQDIIDTRIRPFQAQATAALEVPAVVRGQRAFDEDGKRILVTATQADILRGWDEIRGRYLRQVKGFGWLARRDHLERFHSEVEAFEEVLVAWVEKFRDRMRADEERIISSIVGAVKGRLARATARVNDGLTDSALRQMVEDGLDRLRTVEPRVKVIVKDISWHGSRDAEFLEALQKAIPADELAGWFEEFTVAMQVVQNPA